MKGTRKNRYIIRGGVYESLRGKTGLIDNRYQTTMFAYFSLSGFSKWVLDNAGDDDWLISLEDMYIK